MDVCDLAAAYQNKNNLEAIARHRRRMNAGGCTINTICMDCGEEIPASRRRATAKVKIPCSRCIECQTRIEGNG